MNMDWKNKRRMQHWCWLLLLLAISWPASATAHGSGTPRLVNVIAGPYRLWVWSLPDPIRVGETHFSVAVEEATPPPTTATTFTVQLTIRPLDQSHPPLTLTTSQQDRFLQTYYEADFTMPAVGEWQATVQVSGPAGVGTTTFPFTVLPPQRVNWEVVLWGAVMLVAILGSTRLNRRPTKAQHNAAHNASSLL